MSVLQSLRRSGARIWDKARRRPTWPLAGVQSIIGVPLVSVLDVDASR
jgi:hypothetical protein